jgi:hypothetical protein
MFRPLRPVSRLKLLPSYCSWEAPQNLTPQYDTKTKPVAVTYVQYIHDTRYFARLIYFHIINYILPYPRKQCNQCQVIVSRATNPPPPSQGNSLSGSGQTPTVRKWHAERVTTYISHLTEKSWNTSRDVALSGRIAFPHIQNIIYQHLHELSL